MCVEWYLDFPIEFFPCKANLSRRLHVNVTKEAEEAEALDSSYSMALAAITTKGKEERGWWIFGAKIESPNTTCLQGKVAADGRRKEEGERKRGQIVSMTDACWGNPGKSITYSRSILNDCKVLILMISLPFSHGEPSSSTPTIIFHCHYVFSLSGWGKTSGEGWRHFYFLFVSTQSRHLHANETSTAELSKATLCLSNKMRELISSSTVSHAA